jgi:membrane protease YdiL (CAAX protease family)
MYIVKWLIYVRVCVISILLATILTITFNYLGLVDNSSYAEIASKQFGISDSVFVMFIIYCILSPIIEEVIFRYGIYNFIHRKLTSKTVNLPYVKAHSFLGYSLSKAQVLSVWITALLFGLYHLNLVQGTYAFIMGLFITYCYAAYQKLSVPFAAHAAANIVAFAFTFCIHS